MTTLFICEKPSQANDLAPFVGARTRENGFHSGAVVMVTWGFGHLLEQANPDIYDPALKLSLQKITEPRKINCPHCEQPISQIGSNGFTKIDNRFCYTDGDLLFPFESSAQFADDTAHNSSYSLGQCWNCSQYYFGIRFVYVNMAVTQDFIDTYFWQNQACEIVCGVIVSAGNSADENSAWLAEIYDTSFGAVVAHSMGPWKLQDSALMSSTCLDSSVDLEWASSVLLSRLDAIRKLAIDIRDWEGK